LGPPGAMFADQTVITIGFNYGTQIDEMQMIGISKDEKRKVDCTIAAATIFAIKTF
jgi:hypothetical protein